MSDKNVRAPGSDSLPDDHPEDLAKPRKGKGEMSVIRVKMRVAIGNVLRQVVPHCRRNDNILFPVPKVHGSSDGLESKSPGPSIKQAIGNGRPDSVPQGFD